MIRTGTYTETVVRCAVCNGILNENELRLLRLDTDFVQHGKRGHLIRIEADKHERET